MSAGMRRLSGGGPGGFVTEHGDPVTTASSGDVIELLADEAAPVIEVIEPVHVDQQALGIDLLDPAQSPVGVPVALRRDQDGVLRADRGAFDERPTRDEVADVVAEAMPKLSHRHVQAIPAQTWMFQTGLTFVPAGVWVTGEFGQRVWPYDVVHTGPNGAGQCRIEFARPVAGVADLS